MVKNKATNAFLLAFLAFAIYMFLNILFLLLYDFDNPGSIATIFLAFILCGGLFFSLKYLGKINGFSLADMHFTPFHIHFSTIILSLLLPLLYKCIITRAPGVWVLGDLTGLERLYLFIYSFITGGLYFSICEELTFRGCILAVFARRFGRVWALLVSSFLFGVLHMVGGRPFIGVLSTFIFGIFAGVLTLQTGSVWGSVLAHTLWNAIGTYSELIHVGPVNERIAVLHYSPLVGQPFFSPSEQALFSYPLLLGGILFLLLRNKLRGRPLLGEEKGAIKRE